MTNIIQFDAKRAQAGRIYCKPLDIYFPSIVRIIQSFPDDFDFNACGMAPRKTSTIYTFEDVQAIYPNLTEETRITMLDKDARCSLFIRYHASGEECHSYESSLWDFGIRDALSNNKVQSESAFFTLLYRPLTTDYPNPTITYHAEYVAYQSRFNAGSWARTVDADGNITENYNDGGDDTNLTALLPDFF